MGFLLGESNLEPLVSEANITVESSKYLPKSNKTTFWSPWGLVNLSMSLVNYHLIYLHL